MDKRISKKGLALTFGAGIGMGLLVGDTMLPSGWVEGMVQDFQYMLEQRIPPPSTSKPDPFSHWRMSGLGRSLPGFLGNALKVVFGTVMVYVPVRAWQTARK